MRKRVIHKKSTFRVFLSRVFVTEGWSCCVVVFQDLKMFASTNTLQVCEDVTKKRCNTSHNHMRSLRCRKGSGQRMLLLMWGCSYWVMMFYLQSEPSFVLKVDTNASHFLQNNLERLLGNVFNSRWLQMMRLVYSHHYPNPSHPFRSDVVDFGYLISRFSTFIRQCLYFHIRRKHGSLILCLSVSWSYLRNPFEGLSIRQPAHPLSQMTQNCMKSTKSKKPQT